MKIYVMEVSDDDFEYDLIDKVVVLAESEEQAIAIAKESREVNWEVEKTVEVNESRLVIEFIHYG